MLASEFQTLYKVSAETPHGIHRLDWDTVDKLQKANKNLSEYLQLLINEPSIGLFHVQDHIRKSVPKLVDMKKELRSKTQLVTEQSYDVDYSLLTIKSLHGIDTFQGIKQLLDQSVVLAETLQGGKTKGPTPAPSPYSSSRSFSSLPTVAPTQAPNVSPRQTTDSTTATTNDPMTLSQETTLTSSTDNPSSAPVTMTSFDEELFKLSKTPSQKKLQTSNSSNELKPKKF